MTVQIDINERFWSETQRLARDLNVDYQELLEKNVRKSLYDLRRMRDEKLSTEEKVRRLRESYEKFPVQEDECLVDDEMIAEVWKDL